MSKLTTKKAIAAALKEVMLEKSLSKITVNDIAEKCSINRQTFYYHFQDIPDLVEWICLEEADEAIENNKNYETWQEGILAVFETLKKERVFVRNIYRSSPREVLTNYLYKTVYPLLYAVVEEESVGLTVRPEDKEFVTHFYKYAFVGLLLDWVANDMSAEPKEMVGELAVTIKGTFRRALENCDRRSRGNNGKG